MQRKRVVKSFFHFLDDVVILFRQGVGLMTTTVRSSCIVALMVSRKEKKRNERERKGEAIGGSEANRMRKRNGSREPAHALR
jgi:hypothetical protein